LHFASYFSTKFGDLIDMYPYFAKIVHVEVLSDRAVEGTLSKWQF